MHEKRRITISTEALGGLNSITLSPDGVFDYTKGKEGYTLGGAVVRDNVSFGGLQFDRALTSEDGTYTLLFTNLGTKGIIIKERQVLREINRSYYHADVYEYPAVIFTLHDGRTVLAHCPDAYNELVIEEIETGKRLTPKKEEYRDFFHSRLEVNASGTILLSAGWIWHPLNTIALYDIIIATDGSVDLKERKGYDSLTDETEIHTATFHGDETLLVATQEVDRSDEVDRSGRGQLGVYDLGKSEFVVRCEIDKHLGEALPLGDYVIGFYQHPRLIEIATGKTIKLWEDIESGTQVGSIVIPPTRYPLIGTDRTHKRFAVATPLHQLDIVELEASLANSENA